MPFVEKRKQCNIKSPRTKSYLVALSCILIYVYFDTQNFKPGRIFKVNEPHSLPWGGRNEPREDDFPKWISGLLSGALPPLTGEKFLHSSHTTELRINYTVYYSSTCHQINMETRNPAVHHMTSGDIKTKHCSGETKTWERKPPMKIFRNLYFITKIRPLTVCMN